jgi:RNA polymerase sigma-70 factor (ECF subfamily)
MRGKLDQQRFEALLREHLGIVLKVAGVYARGREERDDLAQEICAQCWRSFAAFDERRAKFSTWMYRVALNVAISHARSAKRSGREQFEPLEETHIEMLAGEQDAPHTGMERDERLGMLHALIGQLDVLNRALVLLYLEDRSYAEIADVLGISETNVATKLNRIKLRLRGWALVAEVADEPQPS